MKRTNLFFGGALLAIVVIAMSFGQLSPPPSGGGGGAPSGPAGGGLAGTYPNPTVATVPDSALPTPSATTLGGVKSIVAVTHQFLTTLSTAGAFTLAQPACADLSNAASSCSTDATVATNISSGTLAAARMATATTGAQGAVQPDGSTVCVLAGVVSLCTVSGTIPSASVLTLSSTPVTALAAIGAGSLIRLTQFYAETASASNGYTFAGTVQPFYNSTTGAAGSCNAALLTTAGGALCIVSLTNLNTTPTLTVNQPITIKASVDPTCSGTCSALKWWLQYVVQAGL